MLAGSEGTLGVITEAWVRVQPRPSHRRSARRALLRASSAGAECVRAIAQSGLHPSNCRLLDAGEARLTMAGDGSHALLVLGFESSDHPVEEAMARALALCAEHGGAVSGTRRARRAGMRSRSWREAFLGAPYVRDVLVAIGVLAETFETAITWERFPALSRARERGRPAGGGRGMRRRAGGSSAASRTSIRTARRPTSRCSRRRGAARRSSSGPRSSARSPTRSWRRAGPSPTTTRSGATTGRGMTASDRSPSRRRCAAAKAAVDPSGIMNPGVLIDRAAMRIAVLGPGGVGGLLAGRSSARAATCWWWRATRPQRRISEQGVSVDSVSLGRFVAHPRAVERLEEPVDVLIVATKASGLGPALAADRDRARAGAAAAQRTRSHRASCASASHPARCSPARFAWRPTGPRRGW